MLDTVSNLLVTHKIPPLDGPQMSELLHYLFTTAENPIRVRTAEVAYRYDHAHQNALDVFLASTLPLAETAAERRARNFTYPTDWHREMMHDGAVAAAIEVFERNPDIPAGNDAFRHYLARAIVRGALRSFQTLPEYPARRPSQMFTVRRRRGRRRFRNFVEERMIARNLLREITNFQNLDASVVTTLKSLAALGPHGALQEKGYRAVDESAGWGQRQYVHVLDTTAIAQSMGKTPQIVERNLSEARTVLQKAFNADGRLFLTH
jgi:hypothetical protein